MFGPLMVFLFNFFNKNSLQKIMKNFPVCKKLMMFFLKNVLLASGSNCDQSVKVCLFGTQKNRLIEGQSLRE